MRCRGAARPVLADFALVGMFAAPIVAERNRPCANPIFATSWRKAAAVSDRPFRIRFDTFRRMKVPPPAAGANELRGHGHRQNSLSI